MRGVHVAMRSAGAQVRNVAGAAVAAPNVTTSTGFVIGLPLGLVL
jgi:hypothetical protein